MAAEKAAQHPAYTRPQDLPDFEKYWEAPATYTPPGTPRVRVVSYSPSKYCRLAQFIADNHAISAGAILEGGVDLEDAIPEIAATALALILPAHRIAALEKAIARALTRVTEFYIEHPSTPFTDAEKAAVEAIDRKRHTCRIKLVESAE